MIKYFLKPLDCIDVAVIVLIILWFLLFTFNKYKRVQLSIFLISHTLFYISKIILNRGNFFVPSLIAAYLLQEGRILIIYLLLLIPSVFLIPIRKMNENEELVTDDCEKKYFSIYMGKYHIRKNQVYFLTDRFDNYSAFSAVSPICIETFDKKSGKVIWHFLYGHNDNTKYADKDELEIYGSDMKPFGIFKKIQ